MKVILKRAFTTKEAASYIGRSVSFLTHSRLEGKFGNKTPSPLFIRQGRKYLYLIEDLDSWLEQFSRFENVSQADFSEKNDQESNNE